MAMTIFGQPIRHQPGTPHGYPSAIPRYLAARAKFDKVPTDFRMVLHMRWLTSLQSA
jgi:hypothetical protein